jgi:hypothetical protein
VISGRQPGFLVIIVRNAVRVQPSAGDDSASSVGADGDVAGAHGLVLADGSGSDDDGAREPKKKSKKSSKGEREHKSSKSSKPAKSAKSSKSSKARPEPESDDGDGPTDATLRRKTLFEDGAVRLWCESAVARSKDAAPNVAFAFCLECIGDERVSAVELSFSDTLAVALASKEKKVVFGSDVAPRKSATLIVSFKVPSLVAKPTKMKGKLLYTSDDESVSRSFELTINASDMLVPTPIAKEELVEHLSQGVFTAMGSTTFPYAPSYLLYRLPRCTGTCHRYDKPFKQAVGSVSALLGLSLVDMTGQAASVHAASVQVGHRVAALIKAKADRTIQVDVKCTNDDLAHALIGEITAWAALA